MATVQIDIGAFGRGRLETGEYRAGSALATAQRQYGCEQAYQSELENQGFHGLGMEMKKAPERRPRE
jgi:hypothetical protein